MRPPLRAARLLGLLACLAGPVAGQGALDLVEDWRSGEYDVRDAASARAAAGWADWSAIDLESLAAAAAGDDAEVARRAAVALDRIRLRRDLGPALVASGLADRLERGEDPVGVLRRATEDHLDGQVSGPDLRRLAARVPTEVWSEAAAQILDLAVTGRVDALVPWFLAGLDSGDERFREGSCRVLGSIGGRAVGPRLGAALGDPAWAVRFRAVIGLSRLGAVDQLPAIRAALGDGRAIVRGQAIASLVELADRTSIPSIAGLLADPAPDVRIAALDGLAALAARDRIESVAGLLEDEDPDVRAAAVGAVARLDPAALDRLVPLLDDPSRRVEEEVLVRLLDGGRDEPIDRALLFVREGSEHTSRIGSLVRRRAAGDFSGHREAILPLLAHDDPGWRGFALRALAAMERAGDDGRIEALLADPAPDVRCEAALALLDRRRSAAVGPVLSALGPLDGKGLARDVEIALMDLDPASLPVDGLVGRLEADDPWTRAWAARLLILGDAERHAARLLPLLEDPDPSVRRAVQAGLLERAPERLSPAGIAALAADEDPWIAWAAGRVLLRRGAVVRVDIGARRALVRVGQRPADAGPELTYHIALPAGDRCLVVGRTDPTGLAPSDRAEQLYLRLRLLLDLPDPPPDAAGAGAALDAIRSLGPRALDRGRFELHWRVDGPVWAAVGLADLDLSTEDGRVAGGAISDVLSGGLPGNEFRQRAEVDEPDRRLLFLARRRLIDRVAPAGAGDPDRALDRFLGGLVACRPPRREPGDALFAWGGTPAPAEPDGPADPSGLPTVRLEIRADRPGWEAWSATVDVPLLAEVR